MKEFWDKRYSEKEYIYGKEPNVYFSEKLVTLPKGKILLPADGEGRNGVYAASLGWEVFCFDQSQQAQKKAHLLAKEKNVSIKYEVADFSEVNYPKESMDCIAFIFVHLPLDVRINYHQKVFEYLKLGGSIILEAFHKEHLNYQKIYPQVGGPSNPELLYTKEEVIKFFPNFKILELLETEVSLKEGTSHIGKAKVVRLFGKKEM
jgi:hypothetical protein